MNDFTIEGPLNGLFFFMAQEVMNIRCCKLQVILSRMHMYYHF